MYPIVFVIAVGLWKKDKNITYFVLPFSIIGLVISIYHNLLYYGIIPEKFEPCTIGVSCTARQLDLFGFISIPLLSLIAFALITILTLLYKKYYIEEM
jgi:disulfide bond formation protein DsbB